MPYLSRIQLNPLRRGGQYLLSSPQRIHAAVMGSRPPGGEGRILWRDETVTLPSGATACHLLVLTPSEPDWTHVVEQAGWSTPEGQPLVRSLAPLLDSAVVGRRFAFRVRANPVSSMQRPEKPTSAQRKAIDAGRSRGFRVAHRTAEHQTRWFLDRAGATRDAWGFSVVGDGAPTASLVQREHKRFRKGPSDHTVTLDQATFEGVLTVTDSARFRDVLVDGLGSGKAYGCGLLTLAPVMDDVVAR